MDVLPRSADWPSAWKATLPKVGSFAKESKYAMKSALVRGGVVADKVISRKKCYISKDLKLPRTGT
jgi:hypothetical protein